MVGAIYPLIEHCRHAGLRVTGPRRVIAEVVSASSDYPDVQELYRRVSAIDQSISISTLYRTLRIFADTGLIELHRFAGERAQVEPVHEHHHDHLIDIDSGRVVEFRSEEIERLQKAVARSLGFELTDHRLVLYGKALPGAPKRRA